MSRGNDEPEYRTCRNSFVIWWNYQIQLDKQLNGRFPYDLRYRNGETVDLIHLVPVMGDVWPDVVFLL